MMGVGAKRALGLYRSCAPRQRVAANELGKSIGAMDRRQFVRPHLEKTHRNAPKRGLPSRFRPLKASTNDRNERNLHKRY